MPIAVAAWPAPHVDTNPSVQRDLMLASATRPYQGYVDSRSEVRLPDLPALGEVARLVGGTTRIRVWYGSPRAWRVAVLDQTGERDIYQTVDGTYVWDFERNLVTCTVGEPPVRLPGAADLLPRIWPAGCWEAPLRPAQSPPSNRGGLPGSLLLDCV